MLHIITYYPELEDMTDYKNNRNNDDNTDKEDVENEKKSSIIKSLDVDDFNIKADGRSIEQDVLDTISDVVRRYEKKGGMYIADAHFGTFYDATSGKPALLQVLPNAYGMAELNVNESMLAGKTVKEIDAMMSSTMSNLPNTLEEAVIHECGHAKAYYRKTVKEISEMNAKLWDRGIDGVSPIAKKDGAEAISEIEVLLHRGQDISDKAKTLYNEFVWSKIE